MMPDVDISKLTPEEKDFYYFKLHDYDGNLKLDGLELYSAISHILPEPDFKPRDTEEEKNRKLEEIRRINNANMQVYVRMIDSVLEEDDIDKDGYLSYSEYKATRDSTKRRLRDYLMTTTIGKYNIDSESKTTEDKMWREFYGVLDGVLSEFEEYFSIQLPVLEATRCSIPKSKNFTDLNLFRVIATYFDHARIDTMQLKCQALIARAFL
ncbi:hypothetical protein QYM36_015182 [Artemia franciscana]|uniref:EF-hand domain-containing protein n=1 Tax=Artemia franciscana TaxID=6661 RepID=A0AA88KZ22_ARTSF|nr:hypothetical protein QYM36_015182 [Artemia franciscana]